MLQTVSSFLGDKKLYSFVVEHDTEFSLIYADDCDALLPSLHHRTKVLWPINSQFYPVSANSIHYLGVHRIVYEDGDSELLVMDNETWKFWSSSTVFNSTDSVIETYLPGIVYHDGSFREQTLRAVPVTRISTYTTPNSFDAEESYLKNSVRIISPGSIPRNSNVISSLVLYKANILYNR